MADQQVPFSSKRALIDFLLASSDPNNDPELLGAVIAAIRADSSLRTYFFDNCPGTGWIQIIWDCGFLSEPPPVVVKGDEREFPWWEAQAYLIRNAAECEEYIPRHIAAMEPHPVFLARALAALPQVRTEFIEAALPDIVEELNNIVAARAMCALPFIFDVFHRLASERSPSALELFSALFKPHANGRATSDGDHTYNSEAITAFNKWQFQDEETVAAIAILRVVDSEGLIELAEDHLRLALQLEEDAGGPGARTGFWRNAIEPSDQDQHHDVKDFELDILRDASEVGALNTERHRVRVETYLDGQSPIFCRLGIHLMRKSPTGVEDLIVRELRRMGNYDDSEIHHEFFLLMRDLYGSISPVDQEFILDFILNGPPREQLEARASEWASHWGLDEAEYIKIRQGHWRRDRLWMIRDHLRDAGKLELERLVAEFGVPDHPTYLMWSTGAHFVAQVSPASEGELAKMTPSQLRDFLLSWSPPARQANIHNELSYDGLAKSAANIILPALENYETYLGDIIAAQPEYAYELLNGAVESSKQNSISASDLEILVGACRHLLSVDAVCLDVEPRYGTSWREARRRVVDVLELCTTGAPGAVAADVRLEARNLLLKLLDDPDLAADRPQEGWFGHDDPFTVAINHVRPRALMVLIRDSIACFNALVAAPGEKQNGDVHLEQPVREALTERLNDPCRSVHCVFGLYLTALYAVDPDWLTASLDAIFPFDDNEDGIWLFVSAWDAYVLNNSNLEDSLLDRLQPYYERAIENIGAGSTTKHGRPVLCTAAHLTYDHFDRHKYFVGEPPSSLLYHFYEVVGPEQRTEAAQAVIYRCKEYARHDRSAVEWWPIARQLWLTRVRRAAQADFVGEYFRELNVYIEFLDVIPETESLASMWELLQGSSIYLGNDKFRRGAWDSMENFILACAKAEPVRAIDLMSQIHRRYDRAWLSEEQLGRLRSILELTAANPEARIQALDLIDHFTKIGEDRFRDIYDKWAGA